MKTVLITGADRGVGFALCKAFLDGGWQVLAGQFMPEWLELEQLRAENPERLAILPLDVSSTESVQTAAQLAATHCDHIDLLVSCAGIARGARRDVYNVNVVGALRVTELFLPLMQTGMKRLAYISSEAGCIALQHRDEVGAYTTSKTALNQVVRRMYRALAPQGYTFRLYHPGWVRSYMGGAKSTTGNFEPEESAAVAYRQFTESSIAEDVLVMSDVSDALWPY